MNSRFLIFLTVGLLLCDSPHILASAKAANECSICREEIAHRTDAVWLPCGHEFHKNCLKTWLLGTANTPPHSTCPACRRKISTEFAKELFPPEEADHAAPVPAPHVAPEAAHAQTYEEAVAALRAMPAPAGVQSFLWDDVTKALRRHNHELGIVGLRTTREFATIINALPPIVKQDITYLTVRRNSLTALPPEIGQFTALQTLNANTNFLTALPAEIGQLHNLKELYLSENRLKILPPEVGQLIGLLKLCVDENYLTALPPEIGQLHSLKELIVDKGVAVPALGDGVRVTRM